MNDYPTRLERTSDSLRIEWSDGVVQEITIRELQRQCPCATCRERAKGESQSSALSPFQLLPIATPQAAPLAIARMEPVGNYAYSIHYSQGCSKGIYTFELLRALGDRR